MVYFLRYATEGCPIKIGYTEDEDRLRRRMRAYNTHAPWPVEGLAVAEHGGRATERELHKLLAYYNVRGEWFKPTIPVLQVVAFVKANPEASAQAIVEAAMSAVDVAHDQPEPSPLRRMTRTARKQRIIDRIRQEVEDGTLTIRQAD